MAVAEDWAKRLPQWIVGLLRSDTVWFGNGDFAAVAERPWTSREKAFAEGKNPGSFPYGQPAES